MEHGQAGRDEDSPYEGLYRVHYARIAQLCRLLLEEPHEAEDAAQEVFLKLLQAYRTETRAMAWGPWLTRVTVNTCRDRRRSRWWRWWRTPPKTVEEDDWQSMDFPSGGPTPEEEALSREVSRQVWEAFRTLPTRQQEVFALRYVEGWSTEAVAAALGLTTGSVKRHLFRAVHRLRMTIGGR